SSICCRPRAWSRNRDRRRRGLHRSSCSAAGASGRKPPGTSPLTRRSLPFVTCDQTWGVPLISLFERKTVAVHSSAPEGKLLHGFATSLRTAGSPAQEVVSPKRGSR